MLVSCATILGYDELQPRGTSADAGHDVKLDAPAPIDSTLETIADTGTGPARPPNRPVGAAVASGKGKRAWLMVKRYYLGSTDKTGTKSKQGWKDWGYDVDGVCTGEAESRANIGTCRRVDGADQDVLVDGNDCRDNNFGSQVVQLVVNLSPNIETQANDNVLKGSPTWIFVLDDLDEGPDDPYAPGKLYRAGATPSADPLKLDGSDVRTITRDSVLEGDLEKATTTFPLGYVKNNVWVSGDPSAFSVIVPVGQVNVEAALVGGVITFQLDADHRGGGGGVIAGALPFDKFLQLMEPVAERSGFCPGSVLYSGFLNTLSKFPDTVFESDTLQDTGRTCDAISIGLGFELSPMQPVTDLSDPPLPTKTSCGDAGAGG